MGGVAIWIAKTFQSKTEHDVENCLQNINNLGKGLNMYRTDNDGFSPILTKSNKESILNQLSSYAGSKSVKCPKISTNFELRVLRQGTTPDKSFYGINDLAVVAECEVHLNTSTRIVWNGLRTRQVSVINDENPGTTNLLFRNGSVKSIRFNSPRNEWTYDAGKFTLNRTGLLPSTTTSQGAYLYTFESKPPEFER